MKLQPLLDSFEVTAHRLAQETEGRGVSRASIYAVATGRAKPSLDTLAVIIGALRTLGKPVDVSDLLEYVEDDQGEELRAGRSHDPGRGRPAARAEWEAAEKAKRAGAKSADEEE